FFLFFFFCFQAEDGIRVRSVTGVQTCALPIYRIDVSHCCCLLCFGCTFFCCLLFRCCFGFCCFGFLRWCRVRCLTIVVAHLFSQIGRASCRESWFFV